MQFNITPLVFDSESRLFVVTSDRWSSLAQIYATLGDLTSGNSGFHHQPQPNFTPSISPIPRNYLHSILSYRSYRAPSKLHRPSDNRTCRFGTTTSCLPKLALKEQPRLRTSCRPRPQGHAHVSSPSPSSPRLLCLLLRVPQPHTLKLYYLSLQVVQLPSPTLYSPQFQPHPLQTPQSLQTPQREECLNSNFCVRKA